MVRQSVKVVVRSRPTANFASRNLNIDLEAKTIEVHIPKDSSHGLINNQQENWKFRFDDILSNASEISQAVVEGFNGTILAYGQTGAGKTFTMSGGGQSYKYRGIIPRSISQIFHEIESKTEQAYTVRVSFVEIYNELMYDLLSNTPPAEQTGNIMVQDDPKGGVQVKGLSMNLCNNEEEALNLLFEGETNRTIAEHRLNKSSTRSHCIYTIHLESRSRVESTEKVVFSKLNLVDLAGSERTKKTGSEGLTLMEANYINKSLSYLEQVVVALSDRERDHIPYRQSRLTHMLKDSIGGNSRTLMIANIWPEPEHIEETISTLRFATRMMRVSNEAVVNIHLDPSQLIKRYEREIRDLKQELAMHDTLASRGRITYDPYTPEQQYEMQKLAEGYLDGSIDELEFDSLRMVKELFVQLRNCYRRAISRLGQPEFKLHSERRQSSREGPAVTQERVPVPKDETGVGEEEKTGGFGLGRANPAARPADSSAIEPKSTFHQEEDDEYDEQQLQPDFDESRSPMGQTFSKRPPIDKNQAFMEFKNTDGKPLESAFVQNKQDLRDRKVYLRSITSEVNRLKKQIDDSNGQIEFLRSQKADEEEDVIDEEEYSMIKHLKDLKKAYREKFDELKRAKEDVQVITQNIEHSRQRLIDDFEAWYGDKFIGRQSRTSLRESMRASDPQFATADLQQIEETDPDALAYIRAKKNVETLHKAKKQMTAIKPNKQQFSYYQNGSQGIIRGRP